MRVVHHGLTAADGAAVASFRTALAANPITITRASFDGLLEQVPAPDHVDYSESTLGGVPGIWCVPTTYRAAAAMLYLHGGVFAYGSARAFRHFVGHMVVQSSVPAFVADYRLAPEHPFPAAHDDARAAYRALAEQFGARNIALVGDSAGGGLALSLLSEEPSARCGVLLSPWTDLALTGLSIQENAANDPILTRAGLEGAVGQYLGDHDRSDARVSPIHRATSATLPIQVHVSKAEILLDDSLRLGSHDGAEVHVWEGMPHVFPSSLRLFEAARAAHELIAAFLRRELAI